jgi:hypothetical protein
MNRIIYLLATLSFCTSTISANNSSLPWIELNVKPSNTVKSDQQIRLLPEYNEHTVGDAVPLYQKAIESFPDNFSSKQFSEWRKISPDQLPLQKVQSELKKLKPTLDLVTQATRCKKCNWPDIKSEEIHEQYLDDLKIYRNFAFALDVQSIIQIYQDQYDQAIETIKTSFTMSKNLGDSPSLDQVLVGISIEGLNLIRIETLIQSDNAPNLYWALNDLPQPLTDSRKAIKAETDNLTNYNVLLRKQFENILKPAHDRILSQMNHIDRKIAALQCIEALRLYAGTHDGIFPDKLSDVTEYEIPNDPVTKKAFSYTSTRSEAVLELEGTENSDGRDAVRYEIKLRN